MNVIAAPCQLNRSMFPMTNRQYFDLWYRLDSEDRHLLWFTDDQDGVLVDLEDHVPSFGNSDELRRYAENRGLTVDAKDGVLFDLDITARWLDASDALSMDCVKTLNAWNLFADVARSVGRQFEGDPDSTKNVSEKLFWGNNLPSVTPPGEHYAPAWTPGELQALGAILNLGLSLFRDSVRSV